MNDKVKAGLIAAVIVAGTFSFTGLLWQSHTMFGVTGIGVVLLVSLVAVWTWVLYLIVGGALKDDGPEEEA